MVYMDYIKHWILYHYHHNKYKAPTITKVLREERLKVSRVGTAKFLKYYRKPGSGHPSAEMKKTVEEQMQLNDETTAHQLHQLLVSKGFTISLGAVLRCRTSLGWAFQGLAYCQLIREVNKAKRLQWAIENQDISIDDVVWTDECTVSHRRFCCRKVGQE